MAFHHETIRKYTAGLLYFFEPIEVQYGLTTGELKTKKVPIAYSSREKSLLYDEMTQEQLLSGNYNVLPKAALSLISMNRDTERTANKNLKINKYRNNNNLEYSYNSVPYNFLFEIQYMCRGMNEATQIIEQVCTRFNPNAHINIWDANNLSCSTSIPIRLDGVDIQTDPYDVISTNIVTVIFSLTVIGNLYQPIKEMPRITEFDMYFNSLVNDLEAVRSEMHEFEVSKTGHIKVE